MKGVDEESSAQRVWARWLKTLCSLRSGMTNPEFSKITGKTWMMREPKEEDVSSEHSCDEVVYEIPLCRSRCR